MKNTPIEANITQLHHQVSSLVRDLSVFNFGEEDAVMVKKRIELVEEDGDDSIQYKPTMLTSGFVSTHELSCDMAHVAELSAEKITLAGSSIVGITGARGPCGYATNTGATGPSGRPINFTDLKDCPSEIKVGQWVVGSANGLGFAPRRQLCHILSPSVLKDGVWCYNNTPTFAFQFYQEQPSFCLEIHSSQVLEGPPTQITIELRSINKTQPVIVNTVLLAGTCIHKTHPIKMDGPPGLVQGFIKDDNTFLTIVGISVLFI